MCVLLAQMVTICRYTLYIHCKLFRTPRQCASDAAQFSKKYQKRLSDGSKHFQMWQQYVQATPKYLNSMCFWVLWAVRRQHIFLIPTCQPSLCCSYLCDNNQIFETLGACMPVNANRVGERRLSELTRDGWVCKTHHYHNSHTSGKYGPRTRRQRSRHHGNKRCYYTSLQTGNLV